MAAHPGARFDNYRLPEHPGDAAMVQLGLPDGRQREIFVSPQGKVLGALEPESRISATVGRLHGTLLLGRWGDWLVELAASWTIVMILDRPLHVVASPVQARRHLLAAALAAADGPCSRTSTGSPASGSPGLVLVMLASGLPWAESWGSAFKWARTELGLVKGPQNWKIGAGGSHDGHHHGKTAAPPQAQVASLPLSAFVAKAEAERMAFPVVVLPPFAPQHFGPPTGNVWTVKSETQNRPLTRQVTFDPSTGAETGRRGFADTHVVDRVVNTGIAWHEGQLFGWANQLVGLLTALALIAISVMGVLMWLRRRPRGRVGAPPPVRGARLRWAIVALIVAAVLLPLFGASLLVLLILDRIATAARSHRQRVAAV